MTKNEGFLAMRLAMMYFACIILKLSMHWSNASGCQSIVFKHCIKVSLTRNRRMTEIELFSKFESTNKSDTFTFAFVQKAIQP